MKKNLTKSSWQLERDKVKVNHFELYRIIEALSPNESFSLYTCTYPYGQLILDKGIFHVTNSQGMHVPLTDESIPMSVQADLQYTGTIPVGIISKNSIETFFITGKRTIPSSFYTPGDMISLWSILEGENSYQKGSLWSISSGARTICMLPKITEKSGHERLRRRFGIGDTVPQSLSDHWTIFKAIANNENFYQPWNSEIIFFSKKWFNFKNDSAWSDFYRYLTDKAWLDSTFKRNQFIFDFSFSLAQEKRNLKPDPYLADTVKHLVGMAVGGLPALKPATDNIAAPITGLQRAYIEDYGLRKYKPTLMQACHFNMKDNFPVYYSLEMPITTIFSPRSSRASSKLKDIRDLKYILEVFLTETLKGNLMIEKTPLFKIAENVEYSFYHSSFDKYNEIINSQNLADFDSRLNSALSFSKVLSFSEFSPFFNGCVAITPKGYKSK